MSEALPVIEQQLASGEGWMLWRARDRDTAAARLLLTLTPARVSEARQLLAVAGSVGGGHVAPALDAGALDDDTVAVVLAMPGGPSLAEVTSRRGKLPAGEVVTLVVPLARTLAALRSRGVGVTTLDAACVWLARDGRPVLLPIIGAGAATENGDVAALATLAAGVLDLSSVGAPGVAAALETAAAGRSDAGSLAAALLRATPALPIAVAPAPAGSGRRVGRPGRARPAIAGVTVAVLAVALGELWGQHDGGDAVFAAPPPAITSTPEPAAPVPTSPRPAAASWLSVLSSLERARAAAYSAGDVTMLDDVYAPGSPVGRADRALLERLAEHGERAAGLRAYVQSADVLAAGGARLTLRVTDALTSYDVIGPNGQRVRHGLGRPARDWRVTIVRTRAGWRIWSISGQ